jgi:hypothetical protein
MNETANSSGSGSGDFLPPLAVGATALHENMISFVQAGFTRPEALQIVLTLLTETIRANGGGGG